MARGPLPTGNARRRNAPTIPTTVLPAEGRKGRAPKIPKWWDLGESGRAFWSFAWHTPQAHAWDVVSVLDVVARRAHLVDFLGTIPEDEVSKRGTVLREMRELDDRLGLTPKSLAALRWKILDTSEAVVEDSVAPAVTSLEERRRLMSG